MLSCNSIVYMHVFIFVLGVYCNSVCNLLLASLWGVAKLCLSQEEIQRFLKLQKATSEVGRGRAWLRAAINERTLENYLHSILAEESQLQ